VNSTCEKTENSTVSVNTVYWFDASFSVTPMDTPIALRTMSPVPVAGNGIRFCSRFQVPKGAGHCCIAP